MLESIRARRDSLASNVEEIQWAFLANLKESANVEETDNEATDVSFSLAADEDMPTHVTKDAPTDLDPDSLEESKE